MNVLVRDELIEKLENIQYWPELLLDLNFYLENYLHFKDIEVVKLLLESGANPNSNEDIDCYLNYLLNEYRANKTLNGELILAIMEVLLQAGANPNRVWCNNYRAYDYASSLGITPAAMLLEKYGAFKELREYI